MYRSWLARQPHRRYWDRWAMMALIGMCTGAVGYALYVVSGAVRGTQRGD